MIREKLQNLLKVVAMPLGVLSFLLVLLAPVVSARPGDAGQALKDQAVVAYGETWTDDEYILAQIIQREAGSQDCIGQLAVAQVVINRMVRGKRGDTIREVILYPHQFTPTDNKRRFLKTKPTLQELIHARAALNDYYRENEGLPRIMPKVLPGNVMYFHGRNGKNHFYVLHRAFRTYVRPKAESKVCEYCKALAAVSTLNLDGAVPDQTATSSAK